MVCAFLFGCLAIKFLLNVIRKGKFEFFGYYCFLIGFLSLIFLKWISSEQCFPEVLGMWFFRFSKTAGTYLDSVLYVNGKYRKNPDHSLKLLRRHSPHHSSCQIFETKIPPIQNFLPDQKSVSGSFEKWSQCVFLD